MTEEKKEFDNSNEAGAIWVKDVKNGPNAGSQMLSISLEGEQLVGWANKKKEENDKRPDFNLVRTVAKGDPESPDPEKQKDQTELAGAAWVKTASTGRTMITIAIDNKEGPNTYFSASKRENATENSANYTIWKPSPMEKLEAQKTEAEAPSETAPPVSKGKAL